MVFLILKNRRIKKQKNKKHTERTSKHGCFYSPVIWNNINDIQYVLYQKEYTVILFIIK